MINRKAHRFLANLACFCFLLMAFLCLPNSSQAQMLSPGKKEFVLSQARASTNADGLCFLSFRITPPPSLLNEAKPLGKDVKARLFLCIWALEEGIEDSLDTLFVGGGEFSLVLAKNPDRLYLSASMKEKSDRFLGYLVIDEIFSKDLKAGNVQFLLNHTIDMPPRKIAASRRLQIALARGKEKTINYSIVSNALVIEPLSLSPDKPKPKKKD